MKLHFVFSLALFLTCCHGFTGNLGFEGLMRRPPMSNPVKNSLESTGEGFEKPRVVEIGQTSWYQQVLRLYNKFLKNLKNEKDLIPLLKDKLRF